MFCVQVREAGASLGLLRGDENGDALSAHDDTAPVNHSNSSSSSTDDVDATAASNGTLAEKQQQQQHEQHRGGGDVINLS